MITIDSRKMSGGREITEVFQDGKKIGAVHKHRNGESHASLTLELPGSVNTEITYDGFGATHKLAVEKAIKNLGYAIGYAEDLQEILKKEEIFD